MKSGQQRRERRVQGEHRVELEARDAGPRCRGVRGVVVGVAHRGDRGESVEAPAEAEHDDGVARVVGAGEGELRGGARPGEARARRSAAEAPSRVRRETWAASACPSGQPQPQGRTAAAGATSGVGVSSGRSSWWSSADREVRGVEQERDDRGQAPRHGGCAGPQRVGRRVVDEGADRVALRGGQRDEEARGERVDEGGIRARQRGGHEVVTAGRAIALAVQLPARPRWKFQRLSVLDAPFHAAATSG